MEISQPNGGGGTWSLLIDHRYQGCIMWYEGKWALRMQKHDHYFTAADEGVIGQLIEEGLAEVGRTNYIIV